MKLERASLIHEDNNTQTKDTITFTTTHNPNNPQISGVVKETFNNIKKTKGLKSVFNKRNTIIARRKTPNIKEMITKAKFEDTNTDKTYNVGKCKSKKCITCSYLKTGQSHTFKNTGFEFKVKNNFSCNSRNVIYVIICECSREYIGHSSCLKERLTCHRQQIRNENLRHLNVSRHIYSCSNGAFKIFPFYQMRSSDRGEREIKEEYFIKRMRPELNSNT